MESDNCRKYGRYRNQNAEIIIFGNHPIQIHIYNVYFIVVLSSICIIPDNFKVLDVINLFTLYYELLFMMNHPKSHIVCAEPKKKNGYFCCESSG